MRSIHLAALLGLATPQAGCIFVDDGDDQEDGDDNDAGDNEDVSDDGDGDGGNPDCPDPRYGDGTCQTELSCEAPDIDCFRTFDGQEDAESFFAAFEARLSAEEFREPRAIIPSSDPRWQRMRDLLDRGWDAYQNVNVVAALADESPALVLIQDDSVNAFVIPDVEADKAAFLVIVHTSVLDLDASDDEMLGLVMHELEHAVGLHIVGGVRDRIRTYYVARGEEPFGFEQTDDPIAREYGEIWRDLAGEVGAFSYRELSGLPFGPSELNQILLQVLVPRAQDPDCGASLANFNQLTNEIGARFDGLDSSLDIRGNQALPGIIDDIMAALRDECLFDFQDDFIDVLAGLLQVPRETAAASLDPDDRALVEGAHFIDGVAALAIDRRERMIQAELDFELDANAAWTDLRYFSIEEAADDATVPVLEDAQLQADGLAGFFLNLFDPATRSACDQFLNAGAVPPYGLDLADEHHATCWRIDHVQELAVSGVAVREIPRSRALVRSPERRPNLPDIRWMRDVVMY